MERLTEADLARMRAEHVDNGYGDCCTCRVYDRVYVSGVVAFPCDAARLLVELDLRAKAQWQGRNHQSPVPHLAGIAAGLFGPSTSEELPNGT